MPTPRPQPDRQPVPSPVTNRAWLLFVHQLPSSPSNLRVRTWRRMQQIGALAIKQSVYLLPDSASAREDFEWLKTEIEGEGGQASVFAADTVDAWSNDALVDEFRRSREEAYGELAREGDEVLKRLSGRGRTKKLPSRRVIQQLHERLTAIERVDFFGSAGRDRVITLIRQIEERATNGNPATSRTATGTTVDTYTGRLWVTRPRPGVDRMASAWLIRRFIDNEARFGFVADRDATSPDSIPFDMFGVELTHRGDSCTFEVLCETFGFDDPSLNRIASVVHDLDLKDGRFGAPEAPTLELLIEGLRLAHADDQELLTAGIALFEAFYRSLVQASRLTGPRPVAKRAGRSRRRQTRPR